MLGRSIRPLLVQDLRRHPAVVLLGACQVGKTTLAEQVHSIFP